MITTLELVKMEIDRQQVIEVNELYAYLDMVTELLLHLQIRLHLSETFECSTCSKANYGFKHDKQSTEKPLMTKVTTE